MRSSVAPTIAELGGSHRARVRSFSVALWPVAPSLSSLQNKKVLYYPFSVSPYRYRERVRSCT